MSWLGAQPAAISPNPVGLNLGPVTYFDSQQMFLNVCKQAATNNSYEAAWNTLKSDGTETNEESYCSSVIDGDGYFTSLTVAGIPGGQQFAKIKAAMFVNMTNSFGGNPYPAGTYRLKFIGQGTITGGGDGSGTVSNSTPNTYVTGNITVASPSGVGLFLIITAINSNTDYPRDISLVLSSNTALYDAGQIFNPTFLSWLQQAPWAFLRFMEPLNTNTQATGGFFSTNVPSNFTSIPQIGDTSGVLTSVWPNYSGTAHITLQNGQDLQATFTYNSTTVVWPTKVTSVGNHAHFTYHVYGWSTRPQLSNFSYASASGVPFEIALLLCNTLNVNCYLNIPPGFVSSDWTSLAQLIKSILNPSLKAYIEWGNETWNSGLTVYGYARDVSPTVLTGAITDGTQYTAIQTALMADVFASVFGAPGFDNRIVIVQAGQAANTAVLTIALTTPNWSGTAPYLRISASGKSTIKAVAVAPYFGQGGIPSADYTHLTGLADGGYTDFFASFTQNPVNSYTFTVDGTTALPSGGWFGRASSWISSTVTAIAPYGALPIICYEGGWQFTASGGFSGQNTFQMTACRDSRMLTLYQKYYEMMREAGASSVTQYKFEDPYGGSMWGLIESIFQTPNPPRWTATLTYIR